MTKLLIKLFIKNPHDIKNNAVRQAYGTLGSVAGIFCNLLLCVLKIGIGFITGSLSIMADGFNNLSDMGSSVVTMLGFKLASRPADSDHPFGHGRMEYMSAFIVSILIILVGIELFETSVKALVDGKTTPQYSVWSFAVLGISILIKLWMYIFNRKLAKLIDSEALFATAKDSLNDTISTSVILISVLVGKFAVLPFNLDSVMGILVSAFILYSGYSSAKSTIDQILGTPPEKEIIEKIEGMILSFEEFTGIHDLIVHNYGPGRQFASVHVEVPQNIDIVKCHEQIDICEKQIFEALDISVVVHMDPIDTDDETVTATREKMEKAITVINEKLTLHDFRMTPVCENQTNLIFDVVVPADIKLTHKEIRTKIEELATLINPTFKCVITIDTDYIRK